jgi:Prenyltransferase and squalene oxidase repeat
VNRADFLRILLLAPLGAQQAFAASSSPDLALQFLLGQQSDDGSWRSTTYGAFRDGRALTPHVLRCLSRFDDPSLELAKKKAVAWLLARGKKDLFDDFPVHTTSAVLESAARIEALAPLKDKALKRLLALQTEDGAWSYSPVPVTKTQSAAPMQQPNLSATTIAIDGLRAAGNQLETIKRALPFVRSCQNHRTGNPTFDNGGFFQMPLDPTRNKAGQAGIDSQGRTRYNSYAAATADGLRCLLSSGLPTDSPDITAARDWLDRFTWNPSAVPADLAYYCARSISLTASIKGGAVRAVKSLRHDIYQSSLKNGSWINESPEMRENDPIVATALALEATLC